MALGVPMHHTIAPDQPPVPLVRYFELALPQVPGWAKRAALKARQVKRGGIRLAPEDLVQGGQVLTIYLPKGALGAAPPIPVVYGDDRILLVEKPRGLTVADGDGPGPSLTALLRGQTGCQWLMPCHRLDHLTGGLLLLAKDEAAHSLLLEAFAARRLEKLYTCLTLGTPKPQAGILEAYLRKDAQAAQVQVRGHPFPGGQPIRTGYRVLQAGEVARLEVTLYTGRTHQIRAHLAHVGHPVLGDDKYGDREANRRHRARAQQLWATSLTLHVGGELAYLDGQRWVIDPPF